MNNNSGTIYIISCGIDSPFPLHLIMRTLKKCEIVAGSNSLIEQVDTDKKKVIFTRNTVIQVKSLIEDAESGKNILILGSGDSLLQGISGTVLRLTQSKDLDIKITPGTTAFQALFSRLNLPWKDLRFFSVHSGEQLPSRNILSSSLAVVYGGNSQTGSDIARELIKFHPKSSSRKAVLADSLDTENEQIFQGSLENLSQKEVSPLSILLLLSPDEEEKISLQLGIKNSEYSHQRGLITSPEVRAVAISKLRLPYEGVVWDIGAGSGSVGVEIASVMPGIALHAVEKNNSRIADIACNIKKSGLTNVQVHEGDASSIIDSLPRPSRVFVGGGGESILTILDKTYDKLANGGRIVLTAVALQTIERVSSWNPSSRIESITMDISREEQLGKSSYSLYRPDNRITIFIWEKKNG